MATIQFLCDYYTAPVWIPYSSYVATILFLCGHLAAPSVATIQLLRGYQTALCGYHTAPMWLPYSIVWLLYSSNVNSIQLTCGYCTAAVLLPCMVPAVKLSLLHLVDVSYSNRRLYDVRPVQRTDSTLYSVQNDPRNDYNDYNAEQRDADQGDYQTCNTEQYEMTIRLQERLNKNHSLVAQSVTSI